MINKYIKDNKLQNPDNRRQIIPNTELRNLLKIPEGEEITFFDLPRYMNLHFIKEWGLHDAYLAFSDEHREERKHSLR